MRLLLVFLFSTRKTAQTGPTAPCGRRQRQTEGMLLWLICVALISFVVPLEDAFREDATYAVRELSKLSDSGVYETLALSNILSAKREEGVYHVNTVLSVELQSPHFASGKTEETFKVVVMTHKEDGTKSIAIDEFPVMSESAIEIFYTNKVKGKSKTREEAFRRLEIEALLSSRLGIQSTLEENAARIKDEVEKKAIRAHLDDLDTPELKEKRRNTSRRTLLQLQDKYAEEETALSQLSLAELYDITVGERIASTFQKSRAVDILDEIFVTSE